MKKTNLNSNYFSKGIRILLTTLTIIAAQQSFSQIVHQPMRIIGESKTHIDVSGTIVRCDTVNQIHLKVFNESNATQGTNFKLTIINSENGKQFSKSISVSSLAPTKSLEGNCAGSNSDLIIILPKDFNPNKIAFTILF